MREVRAEIHNAQAQQNPAVFSLLETGVASMIWNRITGRQGCKETHTTSWMQQGYKHMHYLGSKGCDPFARNCEWAYPYTNDIDFSTKACYHLDALAFLKHWDNDSFDYVLWDPPFSKRQADEIYEGHNNVYTVPGYVKQCFDEIFRILRPGGMVLKLGYNSSCPQGFQIEKGYIVNMGGNINDVIMTILSKRQMTLEEWT
jgi:hypothetical protein